MSVKYYLGRCLLRSSAQRTLTIDEQVFILLRSVNLGGVVSESVVGIPGCFGCLNEDRPVTWLGRIPPPGTVGGVAAGCIVLASALS